MLALAGALAACGGGDTPGTPGPEAMTTDAGRAGGGQPQPLGPPEPKESVEDAQSRIGGALVSGDCEQINALNPGSRPEFDNPDRCAYLKRLVGFEPTGREEFGAAGAVIDYEAGARQSTAVLVRESDGLLDIAFFDPFSKGPTAGTEVAKQFAIAAEQTLAAIRRRDCAAYQKVVFHAFGRGSGDKSVLCDYVKKNPIANLLAAAPDAKLQRAGGNAAYAMYTLSTGAVNLTLVFARERDHGADHYGFVDVYRTNERDASG